VKQIGLQAASETMKFPFVRSSKWLIQHHGDAMLRLAGVGPVVSWKPLQTEIVQPRQLPDGLLEVLLHDRDQPLLCLLEVATYPDRKIAEQLLDDVLLVNLDQRVVPEVIVLVLSPKGQLTVPASVELSSGLGLGTIAAA
jgi:hypothetical protein